MIQCPVHAPQASRDSRTLSRCNDSFSMQRTVKWEWPPPQAIHTQNALRRGQCHRSDPCLTRGMAVVDLIHRLQEEYGEMPGLRLTEAQVERLCTADPLTSASALRALV